MNKRKERATQLRKKGYSYGMIVEKLGISKSTLSCWFKDLPFTPNKNVIERIKQGPFKSGQLRHNQRVKNTIIIKKAAKKELGKISKRDLWMLGIGLYIGEGSKAYETVQIINSDPEVIKLAIRWFKYICGLTNDNMTITLHLYPDNNVKKCIQYWSKTTRIPIKQFRKEHIDLRTNKTINKNRALPYGTARVSIISNGNPDFGVNLHRKVIGWIESSLGQI
ncbi:MAG: hypothetical protein WC608_02990 [Parcubacteria group bacterium]